MPAQPTSPNPASPPAARKDTHNLFDKKKSSIDPASADCARLVDPNEKLTWLDESLGGDASAIGHPRMPAEGPVWWQEGGYLLLSDIGKNQRMKWSAQEGMTIVATGTQGANGLCFSAGETILYVNDTRRPPSMLTTRGRTG